MIRLLAPDCPSSNILRLTLTLPAQVGKVMESQHDRTICLSDDVTLAPWLVHAVPVVTCAPRS